MMPFVWDLPTSGAGAFILHHLIRRSLPANRPSDVVVFVSFAHPFSLCDRILRKMGCNLSGQREEKRFIYLKSYLFPFLLVREIDGDKTTLDMLLSL